MRSVFCCCRISVPVCFSCSSHFNDLSIKMLNMIVPINLLSHGFKLNGRLRLKFITLISIWSQRQAALLHRATFIASAIKIEAHAHQQSQSIHTHRPPQPYESHPIHNEIYHHFSHIPYIGGVRKYTLHNTYTYICRFESDLYVGFFFLFTL